MSHEKEIWLGVPEFESTSEDILDPCANKIGGRAVLFRAVQDDALTKCFGCPKCCSTDCVSLLAQLYAPLDCYDRVLYILTCARCSISCGTTNRKPSFSSASNVPIYNKNRVSSSITSNSSPSFCFALRSQNFNSSYYEELVECTKQQIALEQSDSVKQNVYKSLVFQEVEHWDAVNSAEDAFHSSPKFSIPVQTGEGVFDTQQNIPSTLSFVSRPKESEFALCVKKCIVPLKGYTFTDGIPLTLFVEPPNKKVNLGTIEEQLKEARKKYGEGATLDTASFEQDNELPADRCIRKYLERIERVQSQCVRWCPDGEPLRCSITTLCVPSCPLCGSKRRFECQLTSPLVYFLTRGKGEDKNEALHFSNVLVYTCSKNCYSEATPYALEYVVVEAEI